MKTSIRILLFAVVLIFSQSCNRTLYVPNMQNVPLLKEKNEIRASFTTNNFQGAYGITKGLGVMLNAHFPYSGSLSEINEDVSTKRRFIEAGIGYFKDVNELWVFEVYGGGGTGKISFDNRGVNTSDKFSANFSRYFVQPSIGLTFENVDLAFSLRYTHLNFYNLDTSKYVYDPSKDDDQDLSIIDRNTYGFIEPAITFRGGTKYVKLFFQIQRVAQFSSPEVEYRDLEYNFGVHINIAKRYQEDPIRSE